LKKLKLSKFIKIFEEEGVEELDDFSEFSDQELKYFGLGKIHVKRIKKLYK